MRDTLMLKLNISTDRGKLMESFYLLCDMIKSYLQEPDIEPLYENITVILDEAGHEITNVFIA